MILRTRPRKRSKRRWGRAIALSLLILVLLAGGGVLGGAVWLDASLHREPVLADYPDRPAAGRGTNWLLVGSDSRQGLSPEQQRDSGDRRRHRQQPNGHHSAGARAGVRVEHPDDRGVDTARFLCANPRSRQGQNQLRVRGRRCKVADPDGGAGHGSAPRPLRRGRIRRVCRSGRRARRHHGVPDRADRRSVGRHRPTGRLPGAGWPLRAGLRAQPGHAAGGSGPDGQPTPVHVGTAATHLEPHGVAQSMALVLGAACGRRRPDC